ncbi:hypothetical protein F5Y04DRAFT_269185 [Hypomontagnella monticulosa]|nr:hypothetical protein F5Y04DRAFT_269185 [Hypomontagnella monticulosa]
MSHIRTTPHVGRGGFDALPRSHARNESSGSFDGSYEYDGHSNQRYEQRRYDEETLQDGGRYDNIDRDDTLPTYGIEQSWSSRKSDYTQVSTAYKPDMITCNEAQVDAPPLVDREPPNYRPSALRWPFLSILLAVILALAGLIAWALHALPVLDNNFDFLHEGIRAREVQALTYTTISVDFGDAGTIFSSPILVGRAATTELATELSTELTTELTTEATEQTSKPSSAAKTRPPLEHTSTPTSTGGATETPNPGVFGNIGDQTVTEQGAPTTTPRPDTGSVGKHKPDTTSTSSTTEEPMYSKPESDYGKIGGPVTISEHEAPTSIAIPPTGDYGDTGTKGVTESELPKAGSPHSSDHGDLGIITISEVETVPQTPTFVAPSITTLTNSGGVATATSTSIPAPVSTPQTTTLTDSEGRPTATQETSVLVTPSIIIQTDSSGVPTATATLYPVIPPPSKDGTKVVVRVYSISPGAYFIGMFLPTLLAIILAVPVRILDVNAKILQPWHELAHERGAEGRESLCLDTSGWQSVVASVRSLLGGQALVFLTTTLVLASAVLIPVSAEAIAFDLRGIGCSEGSGSARNCAYVLSVFDQASKAALGLLGIMGVATLMILVVLVRWRSGLGTNPWSICGTASLALNPDVRRLFTSLPAGVDAGRMPKGLLQSVLADRWFKLGWFYGMNGTLEYGIVLRDGHGEAYAPAKIAAEEKEPQDHHASPTKAKHHLPFLMLGYAGRLVFLFVLCGLLALILYYNNTGGDTPFERFMDSESFGVRFLFTAVGVIISFFWASFFSSIAVLSPYQLLANSPQHARRSILLAPPTNAFSGLVSSVRRRHSFLAIVALTSILSEFLTIFLSNIPYRVTQTYLLHQVCTWAAVSILGIMVLVVFGSFFLTWPHMPVDPSTIAGAMYYVCDSWMLSRLEGLSTMKRRDRDWRVNEMRLKYEFGEIRGASGIVRIGVDASSSSGGAGWAI